MTSVIVVGHAGYASAMRRSLAMLVGELEDFYYVDFNEEDSLEILQGGIDEVLSQRKTEDVLFACDISGGSPFRVAAKVCTAHPTWAVVSGLNTSAYSEISFNLELSPRELAEMASQVTRDTLLIFPPAEA